MVDQTQTQMRTASPPRSLAVRISPDAPVSARVDDYQEAPKMLAIASLT